MSPSQAGALTCALVAALRTHVIAQERAQLDDQVQRDLQA